MTWTASKASADKPQHLQMWQMAVMMGTYYAMDRMSKMKGEKRWKVKAVTYILNTSNIREQMSLGSMSERT